MFVKYGVIAALGQLILMPYRKHFLLRMPTISLYVKKPKNYLSLAYLCAFLKDLIVIACHNYKGLVNYVATEFS